MKIAPTRIIGFGVLVAAAALWAATALRPTDQAPQRMGFQVCNSPAENRRRLTPLVAYLERELGRKIEAVHLDTSEFLDAAHQQYDLYHVNSLIYVNLKAAGAADVVAEELQGEGGPNTRGLIIAHKDSGIRTVQAISTASMLAAAGASRAFGISSTVEGPTWAGKFTLLALLSLLLLPTVVAGLSRKESLEKHESPTCPAATV